MDPIVFLAVLLAAILHASWNAMVKGTSDKLLSMSAVVLGHTPFACVAIVVAPVPDIQSWPYIVAGAMLHVGYQLFLSLSFRAGDLSHVYPIARGVSPLIVACTSVLLLGVVLTSQEVLAILLIACGIISLVCVRGVDDLRNPRAVVLALVTGVLIAAYSLVDGLGARLAGTAIGFYGWLSMINALMFLPFAASRPGTRNQLLKSTLPMAFAGGGASFLAYSLVIWSFTQAPIALVTALRETSIVFALLIGVLFLNERLNLIKVFSTTLTLFGGILMRTGR